MARSAEPLSATWRPPAPREFPTVLRSPFRTVTGFLQPFTSMLSPGWLPVIGLTIVLAGAYLVVIPLALIAWMVKRWTVMGKFERFGVYGLVFLFFPGLILFAPFINLRMAGQGSR